MMVVTNILHMPISAALLLLSALAADAQTLAAGSSGWQVTSGNYITLAGGWVLAEFGRQQLLL